MKIEWEENLKNDLQEVLDDTGITDESSSYLEMPNSVRALKQWNI